MMRHTLLPLAAAAALALPGCASMDAAPGTPGMKLSDQKLSGDTITIDKVELDRPGFVVIHKDGGGKPGPVIGHSALLDAGVHRNVAVEIDAGQADGRAFPMLHYDNGDGAYEFPGPDGPVKVDGKVLVGPVNLRGRTTYSDRM